MAEEQRYARVNDVIFEQDKELQRPYTAKALLNMAKNPLLVYPLPKVNPGNWLCNLFRAQRMTKAQIIEKVAADLWLTLEKRDGIFVFRFPEVWKPKDVQDMQRTVLEGIAMLEAQRSLIAWLKERPIIMLILGTGFVIGSICYNALAGKSTSGLIFLGMTVTWIVLFLFGSVCWLGDSPRVVSIYHVPDVPDFSRYVSPPPQGGDDLAMHSECGDTTDHYDEPVACYPAMERI